jgi:hypothetical protein
MAVLNLTQPHETAQQEEKPARIVSPAAVMRELWNATGDGRNLSPAQLEWFAMADDTGTQMLRNLQTVLTGAGCLILEDANKEDGPRSGALQSPQDVADLLFMTENLIDAAVGMIEIGNEASFMAHSKG